ncbi:hypothetical protein BDV96DRAFT_498381 [Lophiotrema nucula]|uniref:Uncharacterized protein n=1 Tax=Lophiotrema nucula TaxID=690887 RepID=A0A6A5YYV4_9PLEO|nr:hypothetical protein BDV96DRAFT_498381 [Lophiotrema nucula]
MAEATADNNATSSQVHPLLRQRMLNRAATFSEGAQPPPSLRRRRSSVLSDYSDTRHSFRSSSDNLLRTSGNDMDTLTSSNEPSFWHSAPLAFALLPAVGGLLFQNGSAVVTDILLLAFASLFLNWCVRAPWDWYHAAQRVEFVESDEIPLSDTILEEDEEGEEAQDDDAVDTPIPKPAVEPSPRPEVGTAPVTSEAQKAAQRELRSQEIWALFACFLGPFLGAYLLHAIRSQLTRPSEGLVSNYNLTIFLMAAELRPVSHVIKMKQERMAHLQRIIRVDTRTNMGTADAQEITRRLTDVESRLAEPVGHSDVETTKVSAVVRQSLQPQLDALNRAVRRYEKRQAAHSIQIEARFAELDARMKDALALAAAAARTGQQPGMFSMVFTWLVNTFTLAIQTALAIMTYPFRVTAAFAAEIISWFVKTERQPRKRIKGQGNGHHSTATPRLQSRNGR